MSAILTRRALVSGAVIGAGALVSGCDKIAANPLAHKILFSGEDAHRVLQRALMNRDALAPEYTAAEMSPVFRSNGTFNPGTPEYAALAANRFADYRLMLDGLAARPLNLSLAQIIKLPARTQITRHDCVEGWSAIGKWHGPLLGTLLHVAQPLAAARYVVFHCFDLFGGNNYYESIDLIDAYHPQTILAWAMNDALLAVPHGAPLRLRVERQLGYKQAKYISRIELVDSLARVGGGNGGYWEDSIGYDWYAGI